MAAFSYLALDDKGGRLRGVRQAESQRACRQELRREGLFPIEVKAVARRPRRSLRSRRLPRTELAVLTRQLAMLIASGSTVEESVAACAAQMDDGLWPRLLGMVRSSLLEGRFLADSFAAVEIFPDMYVASVRAGEAGAGLDRVLSSLADHLEAGVALKNRLTAAMVYPLILVVVSMAVVVFLLARVVPQVAGIFKGLHQELPPLTRLLMAVGDIINRHGWLIGAVLLLLIILAVFLVRLAPVRIFFDRLLLRLPLFGTLARKVNYANYCRTLGMLVASGVPIYEAMRGSVGAVRSPVMAADLTSIAVRVREGGGIREAMAGTGYFPSVTLQLVGGGEKSGELGRMLIAAAGSLDLEVERSLALLMAVVEPALILAVGGVVLFIVLAVMLAVFDLNRLVR